MVVSLAKKLEASTRLCCYQCKTIAHCKTIDQKTTTSTVDNAHRVARTGLKMEAQNMARSLVLGLTPTDHSTGRADPVQALVEICTTGKVHAVNALMAILPSGAKDARTNDYMITPDIVVPASATRTSRCIRQL